MTTHDAGKQIATAVTEALVVKTYGLEAGLAQLELAGRIGARVLSAADAGWPARLVGVRGRPGVLEGVRSGRRAPALLWVRGELGPCAAGRAVAVIGTREPSANMLARGQRVAGRLAASGLSVVSGLALGCDGAAHRGALAAGGHTVAVLAQGLATRVYPAAHAGLAEEIVAGGGALVSEFPLTARPDRGSFVRRDFTQAALAAGLVLVASGETGGSWHATRACARLGRPISVVAPAARELDSEKAAAFRMLTGEAAGRDAALRVRGAGVRALLDGTGVDAFAAELGA